MSDKLHDGHGEATGGSHAGDINPNNGSRSWNHLRSGEVQFAAVVCRVEELIKFRGVLFVDLAYVTLSAQPDTDCMSRQRALTFAIKSGNLWRAFEGLE